MIQQQRKLLPKISVTLLGIVTSSLISTSTYAPAHSQETTYPEAVTRAIDTQTQAEGPKVQSVSIDKRSYAPGEKVKVRVQIKSVHALTDVTVAFNNTTRVGVTSLAESATHITQQANDIWTAEIEIAIPDKIGDTSFEFSALVVDDSEGNGDTIAPQLNPTNIDVSGLAFKVQNVVDTATQSTLDKEAPNILAITTDKAVYQPGDTIKASVTIKDVSKLTEVSLGFVNDPDIGAAGISKFADMTKVTQQPDGHWIVPIALTIPLDSTAAAYKFSHVSAIDEYGNSIGIIDDKNEKSQFRDIRFVIKTSEAVQTDESLHNSQPTQSSKVQQSAVEQGKHVSKTPQLVTESMTKEGTSSKTKQLKMNNQQSVESDKEASKVPQQSTERMDANGKPQEVHQSTNVQKHKVHSSIMEKSMPIEQGQQAIDTRHTQSQQIDKESDQRPVVSQPATVVPESSMRPSLPMSPIKSTLDDGKHQSMSGKSNNNGYQNIDKQTALPQTGQHTNVTQYIVGGLLLLVSILLIVKVNRRLKQY